MSRSGLVRRLQRKGVDTDAVADEMIEDPGLIPELVEALQMEKSTAKYAIEKVLRGISERRPGLLYGHFDVFVDLLDHENSFLRWGAIMTVANLAAVDTKGRFEAIFAGYYAPVKGPAMVAAANIVGCSARIARAKPELTPRITREILKVERATYERHGHPSPECRNVVIGHAIDAFDQLFEQTRDQAAIMRFVKRQLRNPRQQVVKKAERFLRRHGKQR